MKRLPFLKPLLDEHHSSYGEILAHLFFGELTDYALLLEERAEGGDTHGAANLTALLEELEARYKTPSQEIRDLISDSFLEDLLWRPEDRGWRIRDRLGPSLRERLAEVEH